MQKFIPFLIEGGNVHVFDKKGKEHAAQKMNMLAVKRSDVREDFLAFFLALNAMFHKRTGEKIWKDENLIHSGHVFNGSSEAFFRKDISDEEFTGVKKSVGDIDVTVPHDLKKPVWEFLKAIQGKKITPVITYVGNNTPNYPEKKAQINALFKYKKGAVDINAQIDFEFLPYDANHAPTDFSKFSHSSHWDDLKAGLKGVHHKFLVRALAGGGTTIKNAAVITSTGKISKSKDYANGISTGKFSVDRGMRNDAFVPHMVDGSHAHVDGKPIYKAVDVSTSDYITDPHAIGKIIFPSASDAEIKTGMGSFLSLITLMKKHLPQDRIGATLDRMIELYWGVKAQGFERNNPELDLQIKTSGWSLLQKAFTWYKPVGLESKLKLYYENYRMTEIVEGTKMKTFEQFLVEASRLEEGEHVYEPFKFPQKPSKKTGHTVVGVTYVNNRKGANILKHKDGGYFASGGASTAQHTAIHDTPEKAAAAYHSKSVKESEEQLDEAVADHAKALMATGKYDPAVRGSATKFKTDLKATGATASDMTAHDAWRKHMHLHPAAQQAPVKAAPVPAAKPVVQPKPAAPSGPSFRTRDGDIIRSGDSVGFKDGVEQYGSVHQIHSNGHVTVKMYDSNTGDHYHKLVHQSRVWKESVDAISEEQLDETAAKFTATVNKAKEAFDRGDHNRGRYHLSNARSTMLAMKTTESPKISANGSYAKYKELHDRYGHQS